ncbi:MAG: SDR family oxidoreductase [Candidatus Heimdallarchaeota archaeon]|nr:SDR family oxidoreductase [Candidatus Heimdallarchaeota archaeon]MCK4770621.1 SDR family oxidoreductase [Candidatus Heimdallarchaeota archaeon]
MNVVITGSSKGIGFALAKEFLKLGDTVIISSRSEENMAQALSKLQEEIPEARVFSQLCDVTKSEEIKNLMDFSIDKLGEIDIWINNAGTSGFEYDYLVNVSDEAIESAIKTNVIGTIYGCREAIRVMTKQGKGKIFNLAGMGSNGMASPKLLAYGASKSNMPQLLKSLKKETKDTGIGIHLIYPGMVLTDLLIRNATPEAKKFFNMVVERPETVAVKIVPQMRLIKGTGKSIKYSGTFKFFMKMMTGSLRKNRFFDKDGNLIEE